MNLESHKEQAPDYIASQELTEEAREAVDHTIEDLDKRVDEKILTAEQLRALDQDNDPEFDRAMQTLDRAIENQKKKDDLAN